ncbi:zinc finger CCCH domain-containing protein [Musa troglodytarum]|uniref:Zinc finger CCCH domain-containing protein n=1 Tax=Musa troglodytarum TaxID=320322 RepID=A0A9E7HPD4_9LILI|nr:zinc finger CCCH domain-containing protein [Musa troglodytarum]
MDVYEATRVVLARIQSLDAENAAKIMGYILIQEHGDKEMIRLAFGPEALLHSVVLKARKELGLPAPPSPPSSSSAAAPAPPTPAAAAASPSPLGLLARQNSSSRFSSLAVSSPTSFAPPPVFSRAGRANSALNGSLDELHGSDELLSPGSPSPSPFFNGGAAAGDPLVDEFHLQDQLSFLNDPAAGSGPDNSFHMGPRAAAAGGGCDFYPDIGCRSPSGSGDGLLFPYRMGWGVNGNHHRRSWSAADLPLRSDAAGLGWKPCLYFARGYCKDGTACRFLHGLPDENAALEQQCPDLLLRSKSQRIGSGGATQLTASAFPYSPLGSVLSSPSSTSKCLDFLLQQQNDSQRAAAAAALMRTRMERSDLVGMANPGSRQIYLTFPADSTFTEEDVSNYFSIYGPVQDVRIPYQQKRMFGFVTFVYPETVKLILAKGNPHFVCDARVLVKPYKEKGKVPDKCRKQQQTERGNFSGCSTPTGLESRDAYDLQQLAGARTLYNNNSSSGQELLLLRRKLEEQQQVLELQQAIELHARRLMNLQLLDLKNRSLSSSAPSSINSPTTHAAPAVTIPAPDTMSNGSGSSSQEHSPTGGADLKMNSSNGFLEKKTVDPADKKESDAEANPNKDIDIHESAEHILPDSPFASPTKSSIALDPFSAAEADIAATSAAIVNNGSSSSAHLSPSTLLPSTSTIDMASYKSCFLQMPRFSSSHGAIGM